MMSRKSLYTALLICFALACSKQALGQAPAGFGAVGGTVRDAGRMGIPDVTVVLSNDSLSTQRSMDTTDDGVFYAPTVTPAPGYKLKVTRKDFAGWESGEFEVSTGRKLNFEIMLPSAGAGTEATGAQRLIDTMKNGPAVATTAAEAAESPNSGRRLDALVPLAPAVTAALPTPGVWVFHGVPSSNLFLTDGLLTSNTYFPEKPGMANQLPQDAVEDAHIASAVFSTEFGGTMGGIMNASSRSGANEYHGEAYEYFRPRSLQALDRYAIAFDTRQQQHQAGGDVGGPIWQDKIFFFANFDYLDRSAQGLNRITNPLIADPTGTRVNISNCQATAAQCSVAARYLQSQMNVLQPLFDRSYRALARIDYRRSSLNNISLTANAMRWRAPSLAETEAVAANGGLIGDPILREQTAFAKVGWTLTTSNQFVNDARFGWFQDRITENPVSTGLPTGTLGISVAGSVVGASQPTTTILPSERRFQLVDNVNWTLGGHTIRAGGDLSMTRDYLNSLANIAGWYTYPSLTSFALDYPLTTFKNYTSFGQTLGNPERTLKPRQIGFYAEDTWRATRKLTAMLGLRYERAHLMQPTQFNTTYFQTGSIYEPSLNLSPRAGVAYMINDRTVARAGFGWYYAPITGQLGDALFLGNALYQTNMVINPNQAGAPTFPRIIPSTASAPNGTQNITYTTSSFRNPYGQEISVAVERRVLSDITVTITGLHSRGYKLWTTQDFNQANPTSAQAMTQTYTIDNASHQPVSAYTTQVWFSKNNPNAAHVFQIENGGTSWYNGVALQVRKPMSHGFTVSGQYTWSHAIDNAGQSAPFGAAFSSTTNANYAGDKGNSAFDQRHHAAIQLLWQPRVTSSNTAAARYLMNGWEFSTITTIGSSQGVTPVTLLQGQQFPGITMNYTSSLNGSGGWARTPFLPIGSLLTGNQYNVNARIARTIPITERIKAILMFEAFNAFNMQYTTAVNAISHIAVGGTLLPVPGLGAGIASQGFPDGTNARRAQAAFRVVF